MRESDDQAYGHFNSLPHTEVDETVDVVEDQPEDFNSLPHTEVDKTMMITVLHM